MSDHDLSAFEEVARAAWEETMPVEERVKAAVRAYLDTNGFDDWQIIDCCQRLLPDGTALYTVIESKRARFLRDGEIYQQVSLSHDVVIEHGEGFMVLEAVDASESEEGNG
jgi:serine acetyltransferase